MIPTDPKEAANLGKAWGEAVTDSVFGIADDMKKVKAKNIATKARNELVQINNDIAKNNALLRKQAMQEIAAEQERDRIAKMNPAQREAYKRKKNEIEKVEILTETLKGIETNLGFVSVLSIINSVLIIGLIIGALVTGVVGISSEVSDALIGFAKDKIGMGE